MNEEKLKQYWIDNSEKFKSIVDKLHYYPCGIWFTEGFLFTSINDMLGVDLIVESGTAWGQSTEIFANYFNNAHIITCDTGNYYNNWEDTRTRLSKYDNITCLRGNSYELLPQIIQHYTDYRIAVFIDGPKNNDAVKLSNMLRKFDNVKSFSFHDMRYEQIKTLLAPDAMIYHSHNLEFINNDFQFLNEKIFTLDTEQTTWLPYGPSMAVEIIK